VSKSRETTAQRSHYSELRHRIAGRFAAVATTLAIASVGPGLAIANAALNMTGPLR
jgi:hypothetical protein